MALRPGDWAGLAREAFRVETALLPHRRLPLPEIQKRCDRVLVTTNFNFINFHVYRSMAGGAIERLGLRSREETNLSVAVNFGQNPDTGEVSGSVSCDRRFVSDSVAGCACPGFTARPWRRWLGLRGLPGGAQPSSRANIRRRALEGEGELRALLRRRPDSSGSVLGPGGRGSPEAVAVVAGDTVLTYAELDRRSNQAARWLARRGVRPEDRVGVAMERSAALVTAFLGIMKAGAAYVPVDPSYPAPRVAGMIEDGECPPDLGRRERLASDGCFLDPEANSTEMAAESPEPPEVAIEPDNLAYVLIFHVGLERAGRRGVAVPHSALVKIATCSGCRGRFLWANPMLCCRKRRSALTHRCLNFGSL